MENPTGTNPGLIGSTTGAQLSVPARDRLPTAVDDPELRLVVERWPSLSSAIVRAVLALVRCED